MSASNWSICPDCIKLAVKIKKAFVNKYSTGLDPFVYETMLEEINKAVEHMKSYSAEEHKPNSKILALMVSRDIEVEVEKEIYLPGNILWDGDVSERLREDYEQGVNDEDGSFYFYYSCSCDCGFNKDFKFEEKEHEITSKKEVEDRA